MNTKKTEKMETTGVGDVLREVGHKASDFGEHAGQKSDELIHHAEDFIKKYQKEMVEYSDTVATYIKKNPLKSALIAGGIGLLLGRLLKS